MDDIVSEIITTPAERALQKWRSELAKQLTDALLRILADIRDDPERVHVLTALITTAGIQLCLGYEGQDSARELLLSLDNMVRTGKVTPLRR